MIRRPPRSTLSSSSAASDVYKRQLADSASLHLDTHLACARRGNLAVNDLEICSGLGNLRDFHSCYGSCCGCHESSYDELNIVDARWLMGGPREILIICSGY